MQKMAAALALCSAICHLATIAMITGTTIPGLNIGMSAGPHRHLLETFVALETVARLENTVDTLSTRVTAVEEHNAEITEHLKTWKNDQHDGLEQGSRASSHTHAPDQDLVGGTHLKVPNATVVDDLRAQLRLRDDERVASKHAEELIDAQRRRMQGAEPEPEPEPTIGENVKIIKPAVVRCGGPGGTTSNGHFDYARCSDRAFAQCHAAACEGHRRAQSSGCRMADLPARTTEITDECCNEPDEDCSGGYPHTCNAGCAAIFLPFWDECRLTLGKDSSQFELAAALCRATVASTGTEPTTLAEQLNVQCTDGTTTCVPECSESLHGFLMLLNLEGADTKLSCELHHGLYSWVGAATDGGFLGEDGEAFFSAVNSAAPGVYALAMHTDMPSVAQTLAVQPGQAVTVSGLVSVAVPPRWGGTGGFRIRDRGSLLLQHVTIVAAVDVDSGGSLTMHDVSCLGEAVIISAQANVVIMLSNLRLNGAQFQCPIDVGEASCQQPLVDGPIQISGPHGVTIGSHGEIIAAQQVVQYSGSDGYALSTSVQTGAAGLYQGLSVTRNPGVSATMTVRAAQVVEIAADQTLTTAPVWGTGAFIVQETGSLSFRWMDIPGDITVDAGGHLVLIECIVRGAVTAEGNVEATSTLFTEGSHFRVSDDASGTVEQGTFDRTALVVNGQLSMVDVDITCGSSFEVETGGNVTISDSTLGTPITVDEGGNLQLTTVSSADFQYLDGAVDFAVALSGAFAAGDTAAEGFDPQCFQPYELLTDAWRKASAAGGTSATDSGLGDRWFRVSGDAGTRLSTTPPGFFHCGTAVGGWLSDCPLDSNTPRCASKGHFPAVQDGVVEMVVCFDTGNGMSCMERVVARVVNCGVFTLAQLPDAPSGPRAYCTE